MKPSKDNNTLLHLDSFLPYELWHSSVRGLFKFWIFASIWWIKDNQKDGFSDKGWFKCCSPFKSWDLAVYRDIADEWKPKLALVHAWKLPVVIHWKLWLSCSNWQFLSWVESLAKTLQACSCCCSPASWTLNLLYFLVKNKNAGLVFIDRPDESGILTS